MRYKNWRKVTVAVQSESRDMIWPSTLPPCPILRGVIERVAAAGPDHVERMWGEMSEPRWIPLGESLPDEGVDVLWFSLCKDMKVGRRYGEEIDAYAEDGFEWMSNFSHWMPLPEPPEAK